MACGKAGARGRHRHQPRRPSVRLRVVHIDLVRDARTAASTKDEYLASARDRRQVGARGWQLRNGAPGVGVNVVLFYGLQVRSAAAGAIGTLPASNDEDAVINHRSGRPCAGRVHRGKSCPNI